MKKKFAVITGASSGIGEAFARLLAEGGHDLMLVARRKDRLEKLSKTLSDEHSIQVEVYPADLSSLQEIQALSENLKKREVDLLVNNAGFGIGEAFTEIASEDLNRMVQVHCTTAMDLMHAVLPSMIKRDEGAIINVASLAGLMPIPGSAVYPATKSFLVSLTESVKASLPFSKVRFQALCPGYTISEFHNVAYPNASEIKRKKFLWLSSEAVARQSLRDLEKNKTICIPGWINKLIVYISRNFLIAPILQRIVRKKKNL